MATTIKNPSIEPTTLPFPLSGVLAGLQTIVLSAAYADVVAALGSDTVQNGALLVSESDAPGPYDDAQYGGVLLSAQLLPLAVGPYSVTTAASQTNTALAYGVAGSGFVAPKAGQIDYITARLSAAVTGADIDLSVAINGVAVPSSALTFVAAGATTGSVSLASPVPFAAGDVITCVYSTLLTTNTPTMVATVGISM